MLVARPARLASGGATFDRAVVEPDAALGAAIDAPSEETMHVVPQACASHPYDVLGGALRTHMRWLLS